MTGWESGACCQPISHAHTKDAKPARIGVIQRWPCSESICMVLGKMVTDKSSAACEHVQDLRQHPSSTHIFCQANGS